MEKKWFWYQKGLRDGIPIGLGYLTSAGEFAALSILQAQGGMMELALSQLVINARYCLMSCALSQKLGRDTPFFHRLLMAFGVTDEIFGIAVSQPKRLSPFYQYGAMSVAVPCWTAGTILGVVSGGVLPAPVMRAMSVALYGMFLAVIVPPARKSRVLLGVVLAAMAASCLAEALPWISQLSSGARTILLTVGIAALAALLFPLKEREQEREENGEG